MSPSRTAQCGAVEAQSRLRTARAYLEVAALVLDERDRDEYLNVSAGLAVLAGIAASDSICCARLRSRHRGDDHRGAAELLRRATPDGPELAVRAIHLRRTVRHSSAQIVYSGAWFRRQRLALYVSPPSSCANTSQPCIAWPFSGARQITRNGLQNTLPQVR
jgi:hypothetical protein